MRENLAIKVRVALVRKNMTQSDLAKILGISGAYLSDILNGRRKSEKQIELIKKALNIEDDN
ncbi:helix-turn-helix domain-containing protein [Floricoccus penangensis]|uniref:Helix-turn-helix domain-containing protein n=1 Tax=Floricoccus penangensis TaxID=1859475 RepID=A0A9Q5JGW9_9LACT|nr:helix-turn-helix transcriptional regulator [Floricoccus penangensis]OFI46722.1 helix-turn-helix domain-containing protein [Floricoccus penangensis]